MIRRITLMAATVFTLAATPATAQVVGEWQYEASPGTPASIRIAEKPRTPGRMTAVGDLNGHLIVFVGEFRNLEWRGTWYWYGPENGMIEGHPGCPYGTVSPPGSPGPSRRTNHSGAFEFRFNAAEDRLTGSWKTVCRYPDRRVRSVQPVAFEARRMNTYTAAPPTRTYGTGGGGGSGSSGGIGPKPELLGGGGGADNRPCAEIARFKISPSGSASAPDTVFSSRYRLRPCLTTAGRKIQLDMPNPEGKRPIRLVFEGLRVTQQASAGEPALVAVPNGLTYQQGLPFIGVPRPGQAIVNIGLAGRICSAPLWLAWLDFSDGTRSREPVGTIISSCGMRAHPEMVPAALRGGIGESVRPR